MTNIAPIASKAVKTVINGHNEAGLEGMAGTAGLGIAGGAGIAGLVTAGNGGNGGAANGFGRTGAAAAFSEGNTTSGGSTAFNWLRFRNTVNSLGPLGTCSTGGASPGLNTLVVLETGRLRKPWSGGGVTRGGPKNGSTIGGGETAGAAGREGSGGAITGDPCGEC